jgi:hypothetical protein
VVPASEPEHLSHVADHGAGDDRADAEDAGQAGTGGTDRCGQVLAGAAERGIEAAGYLAVTAATSPKAHPAWSLSPQPRSAVSWHT